MNAPLYTTEILRLAASLLSRMRSNARTVARAAFADLRKHGSPSRSSSMSDRRVEAMSQQVQACAFGQASAALLERRATAARARGRGARSTAAAGSPAADEPALARPRRARARRGRKSRHGAILLPFRALLAAIEAAA